MLFAQLFYVLLLLKISELGIRYDIYTKFIQVPNYKNNKSIPKSNKINDNDERVLKIN